MDDLTRDSILAVDDLPIKAIDVPEWKGIVYIKTLTGTQRDEFEQLAQDRRAAKHFDMRGLKIRLVALVLCNKAGKLLFAGNGDEQKLNEKAGAVIDRLLNV